MRLILDASAGIGLALGRATATLNDAVANASWVGTAGLYDYEITNVVWKYHRLAGWSDEETELVLDRACALPDERCSGLELSREALALAQKHKRPAYDMFYFALARRTDAHLATTDKALRRLAKRLGIRTL